MSQTETLELELAPEQPGEAPMKQLAPYDEFKTKFEALKKVAESVNVTEITQTAEMAKARRARLDLKEVRIAVEKKHKELKEHFLVEGRKIDKGKNELLELIEPFEARLLDQENFAERETARIQAEKRIARTAEITPFLQSPPLVDLGVVLDDRWPGMLQDAKDAHAARLAREQKEKEEAEAKAKAEAEERERIAKENKRLRAEAEAAEKERIKNEAAMGEIQGIQHQIMIAQIGRVGVRKGGTIDCIRETLAETEGWAIDERFGALTQSAQAAKDNAIISIRGLLETAEREEAAAKALKAEREAAEAKLREANEKAERERKEAAALAVKERLELEAKARAEKEAAEAKARKERAEAEKKAKAEREAREKVEAELAAKKAAEEAEKKRIADEAAAAAKAPDKQKILAFAETVWALKIPDFTTEEGKLARQHIESNIKKLAEWLEKKANEL